MVASPGGFGGYVTAPIEQLKYGALHPLMDNMMGLRRKGGTAAALSTGTGAEQALNDITKGLGLSWGDTQRLYRIANEEEEP